MMSFDIFEFMKKLPKKLLIIPAAVLIFFILLLIAFDNFIMPWYVDAPEIVVPDLVGDYKDSAVTVLDSMKLNPVIEGSRYDERYPKDHVIYQKPRAGSIVKENRRIYLFISGGEPLIKMPLLTGKTIRDARVTLERLGLVMGEIKEVRSEFETGLIIEQSKPEGVNLKKGAVVDFKVSMGPQMGMIRVPNILGKPFTEAEKILWRNSLFVGRIYYINSPNLLPNTIHQQYPSENKLVNVGDSVDVWITKSGN